MWHLYVNQRFTCTLRAVQSKLIDVYLNSVILELDMKKTKKYKSVFVSTEHIA